MRRRRLEVAGPWDTTAALALLVAHTIAGAEQTIGPRHRRILRIDGELVLVELTLDADGIELATDGPWDSVEAVVRRWFELDVDQGARNDRFAGDEVIGPLVAARPGLRVTGHPDGFEALLATVVGQQISLAAARTVTARLVAHHGTDGPGGLRAFPRPEDLADIPADQLREQCGFMASRARTVLAVARAAVDGLDLSQGQSPQQLAATRRQLLALPGIGPWTADFMALRTFGDRDAFPSGDLVLKKALGATSDRAAREAAEAWRPERAFAALHLWTEFAYLA